MTTTRVLAFAFVATAGASQAAEGDPSYVITWKNTKGYWFARGPVQETSFGEKTEDAAAKLVIGYTSNKAGINRPADATYKGSHQAGGTVYNVYYLSRKDERGDRPTYSWLKAKGITIK